MRSFNRVGTPAALLVVALAALWIVGGRGGPARASDKPAPAKVIAVVDIVGVVERLMDSDRYKPAREEAGAAAEAEIKPLRDKVASLEDRLRGMQPNDPAINDVGREYQQARGALEQAAQKLGREMDSLQTRQLIECYRIVRTSADAIAESLGYTYVVASRPVDKDLEAPDTGGVVRQMISRPILRFPEGADITADVKQDLKLR